MSATVSSFLLVTCLLAANLIPPLVSVSPAFQTSGDVEQWDVFEVSFTDGPSDGNPFQDYTLGANFSLNNQAPFVVPGFYDGAGVYRIRFMPNAVGPWSFHTWSNTPALAGKRGTFAATVVASPSMNHGPAFVNPNTDRSFIFADGTEYFSTGTTAYAWMHQSLAVQNQTLQSLTRAAAKQEFNKVRMLIFPKWYEYSHAEPLYYPYVGTPPNNWGTFRVFDVAFWQHLDWALTQLRAIEHGTGRQMIAEVVLFHPYDDGHWGFDCMGCAGDPQNNTCRDDAEHYDVGNDLFYLRYLVARISAYRHVWWSMANEYDLVSCKKKGLPQAFTTWDTYFRTLVAADPYRSPQKEKSIHQCQTMYNYSQPWTTHFSVQGYWSVAYAWFNAQYHVRKPVVLDEVQYEGNISSGWGSLSASAETDRFWQGNSDGVYVGHSECVLQNATNDPAGTQILWWNYGGVFRGSSHTHIGWFNRFMTNASLHPSFADMASSCATWNNPGYDCEISVLAQPGVYYLLHWTFFQTNYDKSVRINVSNADTYQLSIIDYEAQSIHFVKNVNGPLITYTAPQLPYDVQLVNTQSRYAS